MLTMAMALYKYQPTISTLVNYWTINSIYGGYYPINPEPGFRIIVLNTSICYIKIFWLAYDPIINPLEQLQWFADVMLETWKCNRESIYFKPYSTKW